MSITQNSRERFLLPQDESEAAQLLQKLVSQFPPAAGANQNNQFAVEKLAEANGSEFVPTVAEELPPIDVRDWLIEPDAAELARVSFPDQLIDE